MALEKEIKVPDIGGASGVDVIELLVKPGDTIEIDTPLVTLETDKASMEIPSPSAGVVHNIQLKVGDKVSEGDVILSLMIESEASATVAEIKAAPAPQEALALIEKVQIEPDNNPVVTVSPVTEPVTGSDRLFAAGPGVRRLAHELGVNLSEVRGSGRKERINKDDLFEFVKSSLQDKTAGSGFSLPSVPSIDFSKFGSIESKPLNKIKRLTGINVHRSWVTIPHVTQFDEADITELEAFRKAESIQTQQTQGYKLTVLAFVCKVVSKALIEFPQFNSSLDATGENLIYKQYCNVGIAVETPNGLVVPVIKNVDTLSVGDIAKEMTRLSLKARDKGLMPTDMNGGCFTISSLGGIGGTAFTPIVNSPEVAILGLSRSSIKPIYDGQNFNPRLMLPLSLSYDHRVIDGAEAARFTRYLVDCLSDIRRILL